MEAVRCEGVSKRFVIQHERARTLQEAALQLFNPRRRRAAKEEFWALRDVSFTVSRGRTLGIVGRNGSGKSTLLKLLAGTLQPTAGRVTTHGKVFGLLELAAGFHPELSGRENVFLNGAYLGHSRAEMARRLDQIVSFAELEQFIDTPVKHYSSGMYMRLGFAIAISVDPDILVIDEVLAVGDAAFRQKCFLALADFKQRGKTILFVTHDSAAVRRFCDEAIWLDHGRIRGAGPAQDVLREYLESTQAAHGPELAVAGRPADPLAAPGGPLRLLAVETVDLAGNPERHFRPGQAAGIRVRFVAERALTDLSIGVAIHRADGLYLAGTSTRAAGRAALAAEGEGDATCWLGPLPLPAAEYTVSAQAWLGDTPVHRLTQAHRFAIRPPRTDQAGALVVAPSWAAAGALQLSDIAAAPEAVPMLVGSNGAAAHAGSRPAVSASGRMAAGDGTHVAGPHSTYGDARTDARGFIPGSAQDQALPADGFYARWRPAPSGIVMGEGEDEFLGSGWYPPEDWPPRIRWTARRATVFLTQPDWASTIVVTMCRPQHQARAARGRVLVGGRQAGAFELASPTLEPLSFNVEPASAAREVEFTVEVENPLEPAADGGPSASDDRRVLGVAVHSIALE